VVSVGISKKVLLRHLAASSRSYPSAGFLSVQNGGAVTHQRLRQFYDQNVLRLNYRRFAVRSGRRVRAATRAILFGIISSKGCLIRLGESGILLP